MPGPVRRAVLCCVPDEARQRNDGEGGGREDPDLGHAEEPDGKADRYEYKQPGDPSPRQKREEPDLLARSALLLPFPLFFFPRHRHLVCPIPLLSGPVPAPILVLRTSVLTAIHVPVSILSGVLLARPCEKTIQTAVETSLSVLLPLVLALLAGPVTALVGAFRPSRTPATAALVSALAFGATAWGWATGGGAVDESGHGLSNGQDEG